MRRLIAFGLTMFLLLDASCVLKTVCCASAVPAEVGSVAIVVPSKSDFRDQNEFTAAQNSGRLVSRLLEELGIDAQKVNRFTAGGAFGRCRVAILPYNPKLGNDAVDALKRFVDSGGKLMVCYSLHPQLGEVLGFGKPKYVRRQHEGQFAEMRLDAGDIQGLPKSVQQKSWNIMAAEPTGRGARAIAWWFDDAGRATNYPAVLLSDRGGFFSHILLSDDWEGKKRLLAALLGHFDPVLWKQMAQTELERAVRVGHCNGVEEVAAWVKKAARDGEDRLTRGQEALERARRQSAEGAYAKAVESAQAAHNLLADAYLRAAASLPREGRAIWNHSGTGAYPGDWERTMKLLSENGFNMALPNMLWGGAAHYPSSVLPHSATFQRYGDQIEQCCQAAKKYGIEVHVWKVNFHLGYAAPKEFVEKVRNEGRTQVDVEGHPIDWLCPSHPDNQKLELESMLEVARKYPVDGLHFDYIRYPDAKHCYCDGCRRRFEAETGHKVSDWPAECYRGARREEYANWRQCQITALVAAVSREVRKIRLGLKISAAVFSSYPHCRESVAQDWPEWIKAGYLDFLCPMTYTADDAAFVSLVRKQIELIGGRVPLYGGIGATASNCTLAADHVAGQIHLARSLGAAGFTIFNLGANTASSIVPGVGLGIGTRKAVPPHHGN